MLHFQLSVVENKIVQFNATRPITASLLVKSKIQRLKRIYGITAYYVVDFLPRRPAIIYTDKRLI